MTDRYNQPAPGTPGDPDEATEGTYNELLNDNFDDLEEEVVEAVGTWADLPATGDVAQSSNGQWPQFFVIEDSVYVRVTDSSRDIIGGTGSADHPLPESHHQAINTDNASIDLVDQPEDADFEQYTDDSLLSWTDDWDHLSTLRRWLYGNAPIRAPMVQSYGFEDDGTYQGRFGYHTFEGYYDEQTRVTLGGGKNEGVTDSGAAFLTAVDHSTAVEDGSVTFDWVQIGSDGPDAGLWVTHGKVNSFEPTDLKGNPLQNAGEVNIEDDSGTSHQVGVTRERATDSYTTSGSTITIDGLNYDFSGSNPSYDFNQLVLAFSVNVGQNNGRAELRFNGASDGNANYISFQGDGTRTTGDDGILLTETTADYTTVTGQVSIRGAAGRPGVDVDIVPSWASNHSVLGDAGGVDSAIQDSNGNTGILESIELDLPGIGSVNQVELFEEWSL